MKGLAVLALGAILIWFGLSRSGGEAEGVALAAPSSTNEPDTAPALQRRESRDLIDRGEELNAIQIPATQLLPREEPPVRAEAAGAWEESAPVELAVEVPRPVQAQPLRPASEGTMGLMLSAGPDPERVATFLLESWLAESETDLEIFLKQGEGADLPDAKRQLVASFWQAISGYPDTARNGLERIRGAEGITTAQESLLGAALDVPGSRAVPRSASSGRLEPLAYAMRMILLGDEAKELLRKREYGSSAVAWSDLIQYEVDAPWAPHREALLDWGAGLERAQTNHRFNVNGSWPSIEEKIQPGGNLIRLRQRVLKRRSDLVLCTGLIGRVNGVSGYVHRGDVMRIPTDRVNVIVDLDARVLLYRHGDEVVRLWDVGVGKEGHETPIGVYVLGHKIEKPAHTTKGLPYGDPGNLLGSRWMGLRRPGQDRDTSYGIHGTSLPDGVGGAVSLGCVRMRNEDVNELFEVLPRGAEIVIQE